jgi:phenylalanine-4-hydroxylase
MTDSTLAKIPPHLRRFVVEQNYTRYTHEDQAVWRYIMRQLKAFLSQHAHEAYVEGLAKTGISVDRIPSIDEIDENLEKFGWGAVPVSGFIPPAAFMEFQSLGILPIASDMRTLDHLTYTPAPDIVHEAAGHAPILVHPEYAFYLRQYGDVARHAIISKADLDQYEAIRVLSDLKEDPASSREEIRVAEDRLAEVNSNMKDVSEAALLSRMNWWTAEYGLIGDIATPRIFGAGLLSSVGEAKSCLAPHVKKIPLSVDCVNFSYDITEPQPQLFVARDFQHLRLVLEDLAQRLVYRRGGIRGLERALEAQTVNTVQLDSGLQISGVLREFLRAPCMESEAIHVAFSGPSQLAFKRHQLKDQGCDRHSHGFSSPVGLLKNQSRCLSLFSPSDLEALKLRAGRQGRLEFQSGLMVEGLLKAPTYQDGRLLILTWTDCRVTWKDQLLFDPAWGEYDMAVGSKIVSVFSGPADRSRFGQSDEFVAKRVSRRTFSPEEIKRHQFFAEIRRLRDNPTDAGTEAHLQALINTFLQMPIEEWLPGLELLELSLKLGLNDASRVRLRERLDPLRFASPVVRQSVSDGLALAHQRL